MNWRHSLGGRIFHKRFDKLRITLSIPVIASEQYSIYNDNGQEIGRRFTVYGDAPTTFEFDVCSSWVKIEASLLGFGILIHCEEYYI